MVKSTKKFNIEYNIDLSMAKEELLIWYEDKGKTFIALPLVFKEVVEAEKIDAPTLTANLGEFDSIRKKLTSKEEALEAELKATKYHLEDIRKLLDLKNG